MTFEDVLIICGSSHVKFGKGKGYTDLLFFDQKKKKISNGNVVLMDNGKVIPQKIRIGDFEIELTEDMELKRETVIDPYKKLEELYRQYKYSVPETYDSYARCNFKALNINELSIRQVREGKPRQLARYELETFVMLTEFPWENEKHHYWQSSNETDLILFKEWRN